MNTLENATRETLEELELEEYLEYHIDEIDANTEYRVTIQERSNGNNRVVLRVTYSAEVDDLMDDESWEGDVHVDIVDVEGMTSMLGELLMEELAIALNPEYYDSEDSESDDETETLPSRPSTPPFRESQPLVRQRQPVQWELP